MKPIDINMEYDPAKTEHLGKPKHFDPDHYLDSVEQMIAADEIIFALKMLDNMPGFYRMNPYPRAVQLKKDLYKNILSITSYSEDDYEGYENSLRHQSKLNPGYDWEKLGLGAMVDIPFTYPRSEITIQLIKKLNDEGNVPHIYEMGPSNYYLPYGLKAKGLKFTYRADSINKKAYLDHKERLSDVWQDHAKENQKQVFVCFETIEHLWNEKDILHQYHKYQADADHILISTPCGTLIGGVADYKRDLGHLRTFTPNELLEICRKFWPNYDWSFCLNHMMVFQGSKIKGEK